MSPPVVILPAFFLLVAFVLWLGVTAAQRRQRLRLLTEFHSRLIDRLGSVKDFAEFAATDAGRHILNTLGADDLATAPQDRILRATEMGIVLVSLGVGLLYLGQHFVFEGHEAFTVVGVVGLSLGVGFLVSSIVSFGLARALANRFSRP